MLLVLINGWLHIKVQLAILILHLNKLMPYLQLQVIKMLESGRLRLSLYCIYWVALMAERANHHPEFHNQYRQVTIRWATHSCGGITALDLEMAKICDQLAVDSGLKTQTDLACSGAGDFSSHRPLKHP